MKRNQEIRRRAWHTFLQCICGVIFAWITGMATGFLPQETAWNIVLFALLSALIAALIAAVINAVR